MPPHAHQSTITLDTLGKLRDRGYGMFGTCLDCSALYRMSAPEAECLGGSFDIDLGTLIAERGAEAVSDPHGAGAVSSVRKPAD